MEILRFLAVDVGPYFGVFLVLALVIYWQQKMLVTMFKISKHLNNSAPGSNNDEALSPPEGERRERGGGIDNEPHNPL